MQVMRQHEQRAHDVFHNRLGAIGANVRDRDAILLCCREINVVGSRCSKADIAQLSGRAEQLVGEVNLVSEDEFGVRNSRRDFISATLIV